MINVCFNKISRLDTELVFSTDWNESQFQLIPSYQSLLSLYPVYILAFWIRIFNSCSGHQTASKRRTVELCAIQLQKSG